MAVISMRSSYVRISIFAIVAAIATLALLTTRPNPAFSDDVALEGAISLMQTEVAGSPNATPLPVVYAIVSDQNYYFMRYTYGDAGGGGGDAIEAPKNGLNALLRAGGGQMNNDILIAYGVDSSVSPQLLSYTQPNGCPSADVQPPLPGMPASGIVCVVPTPAPTPTPTINPSPLKSPSCGGKPCP